MVAKGIKMAIQVLSGVIDANEDFVDTDVEVHYTDTAGDEQIVYANMPTITKYPRETYASAFVKFVYDTDTGNAVIIWIDDDWDNLQSIETKLQEHTHKLFSQPTLSKMLPNITDPNMKQDMVNQTTGEVIK